MAKSQGTRAIGQTFPGTGCFEKFCEDDIRLSCYDLFEFLTLLRAAIKYNVDRMLAGGYNFTDQLRKRETSHHACIMLSPFDSKLPKFTFNLLKPLTRYSSK
jgi:hypothetical protein